MSAANIKAGIEISAEVKGEEVVAKLAKTIEEAGIDTICESFPGAVAVFGKEVVAVEGDNTIGKATIPAQRLRDRKSVV